MHRAEWVYVYNNHYLYTSTPCTHVVIYTNEKTIKNYASLIQSKPNIQLTRCILYVRSCLRSFHSLYLARQNRKKGHCIKPSDVTILFGYAMHSLHCSRMSYGRFQWYTNGFLFYFIATVCVWASVLFLTFFFLFRKRVTLCKRQKKRNKHRVFDIHKWNKKILREKQQFFFHTIFN